MTSDRVTSGQFASDQIGSLPSRSADIVSLEPRAVEAARGVAGDFAEDVGALAQAVRDQLARDIADIEQATAALRRAELGLETWTGAPPPPAVSQPRPLWLLIG